MSFSAPTSRAQRSRRILPWLLYLYALVLFAMHFVRIFDNSFWGDEGFSIGLAQMNVFEMFQVTAADNQPPLYYLFTQLLYHLLGNPRPPARRSGSRSCSGRSLCRDWSSRFFWAITDMSTTCRL